MEIHLYGSLRRYAVDPKPSRESVVQVVPELDDTVLTTLERLGISPAEVYHIFLNGAYLNILLKANSCHVFLNGSLLFTRNSMAPWLKYQREPGGTGLDTQVRRGDRLGLFARDMALLVV